MKKEKPTLEEATQIITKARAIVRKQSRNKTIATPQTPSGNQSDAATCSVVSILLDRDGKKFLRFKPHGYEYHIELPVITSGCRDKTNAWTWNGNIEKPTLRPSIKTTHGGSGKISHLWLNDGMCQHLADSTDGLAGQTLPLQTLKYYHHPFCNGDTRLPPQAGNSCGCYKLPNSEIDREP